MTRIFELIQYYVKVIGIAVWFLLCSLICLPLVLPLFGSPKLNWIFMRMFGRGALWFTGCTLEIENPERIAPAQPCIMMGNHQQGFDVATVGAMFFKDTLIVGKRELVFLPIYGIVFWAGGNILLNRKNRTQALEDLLAGGRRAQEKGYSIGIYPEGTRNREGYGLLPFKMGGFKLAIQNQYPILPVVCSPLKPLFDRENKRFPGGKVIMKVMPMIETRGMTPGDIESLQLRVRASMQEAVTQWQK